MLQIPYTIFALREVFLRLFTALAIYGEKCYY